MNKIEEMISDMIVGAPAVTAATLDNMSLAYGVVRMQGETDQQLRTRLTHIMFTPRPDPVILRLFYLLCRLGLSVPRDFMPVGLSI